MSNSTNNESLEENVSHPIARKIKSATGILVPLLNISTLVVGAIEGSNAANGRPMGLRADTGVIVLNTLFSGLDAYLKGYCVDFKISDKEVDAVYQSACRFNARASLFPKEFIRDFLERSKRNIPQALLINGAVSTGRFFVGYGVGYALTYISKTLNPQ